MRKGVFDMEWLRLEGARIVRASDHSPFYLRGIAVGGWLNTENFINGYSGNESSWAEALEEELGSDAAEAFFQAIREHFFSEEDVAYIRSLGATAIRIPFHWRYADPANVTYLDRVVEWARRYGVYVILDLHAVPGWQNPDWHCDNPYGVSLFWRETFYQDRVIALWQFLADRYKDEPAIAGYDLLNEPYAPSNELVVSFFERLIHAIREVDPHHILFVEGNRYARDFEGFERLLEVDDQIVFSSHNYMTPTHEGSSFPGWLEVDGRRTWIDESWIEAHYRATNAWFLERGLTCYVGEFGALYDAPFDAPSSKDLARLRALEAQIALFNKLGAHWTLWTYKDIGVQGVRVIDPNSAYYRRIKPFLELKKRLGVEKWTARGRGPLAKGIRALLQEMEEEVVHLLQDYALAKRQLEEALLLSALYGHIAGALNPFLARLFAGLSPSEIYEEVKEGVRFSRTKERTVLAEVLRRQLASGKEA